MRGGLCRKTQAQTVHIVGGDHGVHRTQINLGGNTRIDRRFHEVLDQGFGHPNHGFRSREVLQARHKRIHTFFGVGESFRAVFSPEVVLLHLRVGQCARGTGKLKCSGWDGVESKARIGCASLHLELVQTFGRLEEYQHIVLREHLFARGQFFVGLIDLHRLYEVDARVHWYAHFHALHPIGAVGQHIEFAGEAEVLRIVGRELNFDTAIAVDHGGIGEEKAVERDAVGRGKWGDELILEQTDVVVVEIHVGKHIFHHRIEHIARVDQIVDALAALTDHNVLARLVAFAPQLLRHGFIDGEG